MVTKNPEFQIILERNTKEGLNRMLFPTKKNGEGMIDVIVKRRDLAIDDSLIDNFREIDISRCSPRMGKRNSAI